LLLEGQAFVQLGSQYLEEDGTTEKFIYIPAMKEKELVAIKKELRKDRLKFFQFQIKLEKQQFSVTERFVSCSIQYFAFKEGELCL